MKLRIAISIAFSLALHSCQTGSSVDDELTAYIALQTGAQPDAYAIYCLIPDNQCQNCFRFDGLKLSPDANDRLVIISGFPASNFMNFRHVYHDRSNGLLRLRSLDYGNRLLVFHDGEPVLIPLRDLYIQADSLAARP